MNNSAHVCYFNDNDLVKTAELLEYNSKLPIVTPSTTAKHIIEDVIFTDYSNEKTEK